MIFGLGLMHGRINGREIVVTDCIKREWLIEGQCRPEFAFEARVPI